MALLHWEHAFATGIPAADHEHGKMIDLINTTYARWERTGRRDLVSLFDELDEIFVTHFKFEGGIMSGSNYADQAAHARDHDRVLKELSGIRARANGKADETIAAVASLIQRWLAEHIRDHDAPFYHALTSN